MEKQYLSYQQHTCCTLLLILLCLGGIVAASNPLYFESSLQQASNDVPPYLQKENYASKLKDTSSIFQLLQPETTSPRFITTHPARVDHEGNFLSHDVKHFIGNPPHPQETFRSRRRRNAIETPKNGRLYYKVKVDNEEIVLNVSENTRLVHSQFVVERLQENEDKENFRHTAPHHRSTIQRGSSWPCHFRGHVIDHPSSTVAISTCNGLTGLIRLQEGDFFIEPIDEVLPNSGIQGRQAHKIYKRDVSNLSSSQTSHEFPKDKEQTSSSLHHESSQRRRKGRRRGHQAVERKVTKLQAPKRNKNKTTNYFQREFCGVKDTKLQYQHDLRRRELWQDKHRLEVMTHSGTSSTRHRRSLSLEHWIEMMVVVDKKMVEYYEAFHRGEVERYVLTIVNMVSELFHDVSIGNSLHVTLIRLIILEGEENTLKVSSHAERTLDSFCRFAKRMNPRSDHHANHHDVAVLMTRRNLCSQENKSCETLGLAHVAGMCQAHRSCNVNQDTGLSLAFTVAHELGHNFAMHHDGQLNSCKPNETYPRVMAPHLTSNNLRMRWSSCSRRYVTKFLDRNWGFCLMDAPSDERDHFDFPSELPGFLYDGNHQCRLMFGPRSRQCKIIDDMCSRLWCVYKGTCRSRLHAAVPGTKCAPGKWCYGGACVRIGKRPSAVDGSWSPWSKWSRCSRTCDVGVSSSARYCNQPSPKHGGRYCLGERKRYKTCNVWSCPKTNKTISFRSEQCAAFNNILYRNRTYNWLPSDSPVYPCELHCYTRDSRRPFTDRLRDKVVDGTRCFSHGKDICVDGLCKHLGCDFKIDSEAKEDGCGVCRGDGTSCSAVNTTNTQRFGDEYVQVGLLPKGARNIKVHEAKSSGNFLALRNPLNEDDYYLNGNYMIQWDFQFDLAGTVFNYKRMNTTLDNITADGPITHDVAVVLLFVEENPGIEISYILPDNVTAVLAERRPEFKWTMRQWTPCSRTCGEGLQLSLAICVERKAGVVEEDFCDAETRPEDKRRICSNPRCLPEWFSGPWQPCSVTCGGGMGRQKRTVLCVRSLNDDEQVVLNRSECVNVIEPESMRSCSPENHRPCPVWRTGGWGNCSKPCGGGNHSRSVMCVTYIIHDVITIDDDMGHFDDEYGDLPYVDHTGMSFRSIRKRTRKARLSLNVLTVVKRRKEKNLLEDFDYAIEDDEECDSDAMPPITEPCNTPACEVVLLRSMLLRTSPSSPHGNASSDNQELRDGSGANVANYTNFDKDFDVNDDLNITFNNSKRNEGSTEYEDLLDMITLHSGATELNDTSRSNSIYGTTASLFDIEGSGSSDVDDEAATTQTNTESFVIATTTTTTVETSTLAPKWFAGAWGQCSTTCGVGARRRNVICSTGPGNCRRLKKPIPLQRCNLRPCVRWQYGDWTKCSRMCGEGHKRRKVQCRDSRTNKLIRPYHCSSIPKPRKMNVTCNSNQCLPWKTSRWSVCSVSCGEGTTRRRVACSKKGLCDPASRPRRQKNCLLRKCVSWKASHWQRCPVNCGYGMKRRMVRCVERESGISSRACNPMFKPDTTKKCNKGPCRVTEFSLNACASDRLNPRFCYVLMRWGKCIQPSLAIQCCKTCRTSFNIRRKDKIS